MGKLFDFLSGIQILQEVESPINGKITVVKDLAWGTHFQVDGVTQSGGILKKVWETTLKKVAKDQRLQTNNCLILGLGGGSVAQLIRKYWLKAKITGVDIDPMMVGLGEKYLGLSRVQVQVQVQDAYDFVSTSSLSAGKAGSAVKPFNGYDLICIDLYLGSEFPKKFESEVFLRLVLKLLTSSGVAIFNHLYGYNHRTSAIKFGKKLERVFKKVNPYYPEANVMFICSK
ncbi:hypothetical protein A3D00_03590 [Candidatus Woesebacteria bacterium RIFCSPHIGHO2_02_FULL_38_9]|uniref:PABS domain-containing protein n=1 Tax=Candidatus Woesebacteria bacterium RIFCSPHIGHO2_01_FULL_39_28 TaxID=1802496 RepID=A0A1F7YIY4_9BACT|nr:MAG: hypothetical protein A2627_00915 [Candidatus Woesebacteria bacterium RIFCSPHIGHO2_01_FULL_39_28]OGM32577.1 MAG: hypothetical protein A3D00_03590 [Candidatus Woesebacteria bacterium RIFCSPHIGHO2_02_FULL_38_9]OGM58723.1 MAG: hypothetical protein A3A50_02945 [Candidatus Woesebacteria bacterium RIFCSPLOWO2_01_FULL_38_20]